MNERFDLETAIDTWRRFLLSERAISTDDADELEVHLRDGIDAQIEAGRPAEDAFRLMVRSMGETASIQKNYRSVYWSKVLAERHFSEEITARLSMLKSYLVVAARNLRRQVGYVLVNVVGLALGIACCILLFLHVRDERSFDAFHESADRIYRVVEQRGDSRFADTVGALGPQIVSELSGAEAAVRFRPFIKIAVERGDTRFLDFDYLLAEPSFFDVFSFDVLAGDVRTALTEPGSAVLTESFAQKVFGRTDVVGETYTAGFWGDVIVSGVMQDPPSNSHLQFSQLISMETAGPGGGFLGADRWDRNGFITYILLADPANSELVESGIPDVASERLSDPEISDIVLQPLKDIHFGSSEIAFERNAHEGQHRHVAIFAAIMLGIALIACINYVNLATAQSLRRARELSMRKVIGARRSQLIQQLLGESILLAILGLAVSLVFVWLALPEFNALTEKELTLHGGIGFWLGLVVIGTGVGVAAGAIPSLRMSGLHPVEGLSGSGGMVGQRSVFRRFGLVQFGFRQGLIVFQFCLSMIMLIGMVVISDQLEYILGRNLGFDEEHLIAVHIEEDVVENGIEPFKQALESRPGVLSAAASSSVPADWMETTGITLSSTGTTSVQELSALFLAVDDDFLATYGIELTAGANLTEGGDSSTVLVNQAAVRQFGWNDPVGRVLHAGEMMTSEEGWGVERELVIAGVVEDIHFESMREPVKPMVFGHWTGGIQSIEYYTVRIDGGDVESVLEEIRDAHATVNPGYPVQLSFLDEAIEAFYQGEQRTMVVFRIASTVAVFIACLGLFGLAAYSTRRRRKEIGIRKALGSSVIEIVGLLSKEVAVLIGMGFVLAAPTAYILMDQWLHGFAYRTALSIWIFIIVGSGTLTLALMTVAYHSIRGALADPVRCLRQE